MLMFSLFYVQSTFTSWLYVETENLPAGSLSIILKAELLVCDYSTFMYVNDLNISSTNADGPSAGPHCVSVSYKTYKWLLKMKLFYNTTNGYGLMWFWQAVPCTLSAKMMLVVETLW